MIWEVFHEETRNVATLTGHTNAITEICWSPDDTKVYTSSADNTIAAWDVYEGKRLKKFKEHSSFVNSIDANIKGTELVRFK